MSFFNPRSSLRNVQKRLSKSISRAGELFTGVGPSPVKQFKNAIIDRDEEKAISLYTSATENDLGGGGKDSAEKLRAEQEEDEGETAAREASSYALMAELHPSQPFPSKKNQNSDTPLHLAAKFGLMKLVIVLLECGGEPNASNFRGETCLHSLCSQPNSPETRKKILDVIINWTGVGAGAGGERVLPISVREVKPASGKTLGSIVKSKGSPVGFRLFSRNDSSSANITTPTRMNNNSSTDGSNSGSIGSDLSSAGYTTPSGEGYRRAISSASSASKVVEKASLNHVDEDGNCAVHNAAANGLVACVERLVQLGAIISIVNKSHRTCCEIADQNSHVELATMLELALVFQPVDATVEEFILSQAFPYEGQTGKLLIASHSLTSGGVNDFVEESVQVAAETVGETRARVEVALNAFLWDAPKFIADFVENAEIVLRECKLQPPYVAAAFPAADATSSAAGDAVSKPVEVHSSMEEAENRGGCKEGVSAREGKGPLAGSDAVTAITATTTILGVSAVEGDVSPTIDIALSLDEIDFIDGTEADVNGSSPGLVAGNRVGLKTGYGLAATGMPHTTASASASVSSLQLQQQREQQKQLLDQKGIRESEGGGDMEETEMCTICGDMMLKSLPVELFVKDKVVEPGRRELCCAAPGVGRAPHKFCVDCWSGHLGVQVGDNGLGCMPCPGYKCGEILELQWAPVMLKKQELVNRLLAQRLRHVIDCSGLKTCPIENCGLLLHIPEKLEELHKERILKQEQQRSAIATATAAAEGAFTAGDAVKGDDAALVSKAAFSSASADDISMQQQQLEHDQESQHGIPRAVICGNGHAFCLSCFQPAHAPCSCEEATKWHKTVAEETAVTGIKDAAGAGGNADEMANALWVAANTKRCPRCSTPIEKDEGCNHMTCRKCRKDFCWICMQDWSLHSDNTGGYFQCNRFVATENNGSGGSNGGEGGEGGERGSDEGVVGMWAADERGNAHAETMRLRQRGRKMARFIHYFTRYKAHGDSVVMETRMHVETVARIMSGLKASMSGKLRWLQGALSVNPLEEIAERKAEEREAIKAAAAGSARANLKLGSESGIFSISSPRNAANTNSSTNTAGNSKIGGFFSSSPTFPAAQPAALVTPSPKHPSSSTAGDPAGAGSLHSFAHAAGSGSIIEKHYHNKTEECLRFLNDGFDELKKCRYLLQWSYPYAFYEFDGSEENDFSRASMRRFNSRMERLILDNHRLAFEMLQADLESFVETLSDVCARRRLRATRSDIAQAARAARSKRIELEVCIITYALSKQEQLAEQRVAERDRAAGIAFRRGSAGGVGAVSLLSGSRGGDARGRTDYRQRDRGLRTRSAGLGSRIPVEGSTNAGAAGGADGGSSMGSMLQQRLLQSQLDPQDSVSLATLLYELELAGWGGDEEEDEEGEDGDDYADRDFFAHLDRRAPAAVTPPPALISAATTPGGGERGGRDKGVTEAREAGVPNSEGLNNAAEAEMETSSEQLVSALAEVGLIGREAAGAGTSPAGTTAAVVREQATQGSSGGSPQMQGEEVLQASLGGVDSRLEDIHQRMQRIFEQGEALWRGQGQAVLPVGTQREAGVGVLDSGSRSNTSSPRARPVSLSAANSSWSTIGSSNSSMSSNSRSIDTIMPNSSASVGGSADTLDTNLSRSLSQSVSRSRSVTPIPNSSAGSLPQRHSFRINRGPVASIASTTEGIGAAGAGAGIGRGALNPAGSGVPLLSPSALSTGAATAGSHEQSLLRSASTPAVSPSATPLAGDLAASASPSLGTGTSTGIGVGEGTGESENASGARAGRRSGSSSRRSAGGGRGGALSQQARLARLTRRAEEEAELNRAILMSLQDPPPTDAAATAVGSGGGGEAAGSSSSSSQGAPSAESIALLVSMGFTEEQATQALRESRHDVQLAANRLLGADL